MFKNKSKFVFVLLIFGLLLPFTTIAQDCDKLGLVGNGKKLGLPDCPLVILSVNDGNIFIPSNQQDELSDGDLILFSFEVTIDSFACSTKYTSISINCLDKLSAASTCAADFIAYPEDILFSRTYSYDLLVTNSDYQYEWSFGDGSTSMASNPTHTYQQDGDFVVCLSVSNESCQDTNCDTLSVSTPLFHTCDFSIETQNIGNTYQLEAFNTTELGLYHPQKVSWYNYESGLELGNMPVISYTLAEDAPLFINVCADIEAFKEDETTCTTTLCKTLFNQDFFTSNPADSTCAALFTYLPSSNLGTVEFYNHSLEGIQSVAWDFGDGNKSTSQAAALSHTYATPGLYEVCLSVQDSMNCTASLCLPVFTISGDAICDFTDCVFPGDTDKNGRVDIFDALAIGLSYNQIGSTRPNATIEPLLQAALDWLSPLFGNLDSKHADCDGNGFINAADYEAIDNNYQAIEEKAPLVYNEQLPPVTLTFHADTLVMENIGGNEAIVHATLSIGSGALPLEDVYGIAISFDYQSDNIQGIQTSVLDTSFLGTENAIFKQEKHLPTDQQYGLAISKMDQRGVGGAGPVAELGFVIIGDLGDGRTDINLSIQNIRVIDSKGIEIPVSIPKDTTQVTIFSVESRTVSTEEEVLKRKVAISPNPANELLHLSLDETLSVKDGQVEIYNTLGAQVAQQAITKNNSFIDISQLAEGVYWVNILLEEGRISKQIVIVE